MAKLNSIDILEGEIGIYFKYDKDRQDLAIQLFGDFAGKELKDFQDTMEMLNLQ